MVKHIFSFAICLVELEAVFRMRRPLERSKCPYKSKLNHRFYLCPQFQKWSRIRIQVLRKSPNFVVNV